MMADWNRIKTGEYRLVHPGYHAAIARVKGGWYRFVYSLHEDAPLIDSSFISGTLSRAKEVVEDAIQKHSAA